MTHHRIPKVFLSLLLIASAALAVGGTWTPEQLLDHRPEWLEELGLEMPAQELWSPGEGGLLEAVVQVRGCSSGFVSPRGLLITNHHCVFGILQHHSTADNDVIESGYLAESSAAELPGFSPPRVAAKGMPLAVTVERPARVARVVSRGGSHERVRFRFRTSGVRPGRDAEDRPCWTPGNG